MTNNMICWATTNLKVEVYDFLSNHIILPLALVTDFECNPNMYIFNIYLNWVENFFFNSVYKNDMCLFFNNM